MCRARTVICIHDTRSAKYETHTCVHTRSHDSVFLFKIFSVIDQVHCQETVECTMLLFRLEGMRTILPHWRRLRRLFHTHSHTDTYSTRSHVTYAYGDNCKHFLNNIFNKWTLELQFPIYNKFFPVTSNCIFEIHLTRVYFFSSITMSKFVEYWFISSRINISWYMIVRSYCVCIV